MTAIFTPDLDFNTTQNLAYIVILRESRRKSADLAEQLSKRESIARKQAKEYKRRASLKTGRVADHYNLMANEIETIVNG